LAANVEEIKDLGILVAPGFGKENRRKVEAVRYARENKVPFRNLFGDANGHEYSRNVLGYSDANSTEMNEQSILSLI
jgi:CTP synthase